MKKHLLPITIMAMTLTFAACNHADTVDPLVMTTADDAKRDEIITAIASESMKYVNQNKGNLNEAHARARKPTATQIRALFDFLDVDRSGQISATELFDALNNAGIRVTEVQVQQIIEMFDTNNSGMMEYDEYERLVDEASKVIGKALKRAD